MTWLEVSGSLAVVVLLMAWVVYPVGLWMLGGRRESHHEDSDTDGRTLAAVIVTRDHPNVVRRRVTDLRSAEGVVFEEVVVVVDFAQRERVSEYETVLMGDARVIVGDPPGGKAAGLNSGISAVTADLVVLADSWQTFRPDAVARLMDWVAGGSYQAVSGRVAHAREDWVMRTYWTYENMIRRAQARRHSVVTTSGAITLIRRDVWIPLPAGVICDDLFMSVSLAMTGSRVGYDPEAVAEDPREHSKRELFQKKVRTLTGLWQLILWKPAALLPWRNPVWLDLMLHKVARLATPPLAFLAAVGLSVAVVRWMGGATLYVLPAATLALIVVLGVRPALGRRVGRAALWAGLLLFAPVLATYNGLRGQWGVWTHHVTPGGT